MLNRTHDFGWPDWIEVSYTRHTVGPLMVFPAAAGTLGMSPPMPSTEWALSCLASLLHRWCTRLPATGPTPSGSTPCWTLHKCKVAGAKPTPKTKSSKWGCRGSSRGRVPGTGAWKVAFLSSAHMASCVFRAAPSSQSSSGQSTRCWRLCTSFPAAMTMGSLPKTSARCEGPLFPHHVTLRPSPGPGSLLCHAAGS